jgi:hypothetical protein
MSMTFPVRVSTLADYLPHRPPMVWIEQVLAADLTGGICLARYGENDFASGLTFAPVEWIAQAFGYARACHDRLSGGTSRLDRAFVAAVSDLTWSAPLPRAGVVRIEARVVREMAPLLLVRGTVTTEDGAPIAAAALKLFAEAARRP